MKASGKTSEESSPRKSLLRSQVIGQQGQLVRWHLRAGITITQRLPWRCFPWIFPRSALLLIHCRVSASQLQLAPPKFAQNYCQLGSLRPSQMLKFSNGQNKAQCSTTLGCFLLPGTTFHTRPVSGKIPDDRVSTGAFRSGETFPAKSVGISSDGQNRLAVCVSGCLAGRPLQFRARLDNCKLSSTKRFA